MFKYLWIVILVIIEIITGYISITDIIDSIKTRTELGYITMIWLLTNGVALVILFATSLASFIIQGGTP